MTRRMADPEFREQQYACRMEPRIAPINRFVALLRELGGRGWAPEVAPMHGGVNAHVLNVLRDPGKRTQSGVGSGFLCVENDDPTAAAQLALFEQFGIDPSDVLPWNAYPWYIDRAPRADELEIGAAVMVNLFDLLPELKVVLLQGNEAVAAWKRVLKRWPGVIEERGLEVVESIHPGPQALWTTDENERRARRVKQQRAYKRVARVLA
jgi:hypothetical protein